MSPFLRMPLLALAVLVPVMALAWLRQRRTGDAGVVDLVWAASLGLMAVAYALFSKGWVPRRVLVATLAGLWSARLTWHLAQRSQGAPEDGRYASLRAAWGDRYPLWMFLFFQAQALLAVLLSLAYLTLCVAEAPGWRVQDLAAVLIACLSLAGETLADRQLDAWRRDPSNRGRTCRAGLWAYSRHPNYFFEWLHWWVYPILGIGLEGGVALWLAPALMLFLMVKVTGIPPTEAQSLRSRGDDYRAYQRSTNAFFPGPTKRDPHALLSDS